MSSISQYLTIILLSILVLVAVIGAIIGIVKGYTKSSFWGGAVIFTVLIGKLVAYLAKNFNNSSIFLLVFAIALLLVMILLLFLVKKFLKRKIEKRQELSYYEKYDARAENEELILDAVDKHNKKEYKKLVKEKKKFKEKRGAWGIVDRVFGGVTVALNASMYYALFISFLLVLVDFAHIDFLSNLFANTLSNPGWTKVGARLALDLLFVSTIFLAISLGFKSGISGTILTIFFLCLLGLSGYLSFHIAYQVEGFNAVAEAAANGGLKTIVDSLTSMASMFGKDEIWCAKLVLMGIMFVAFLIIAIVIIIFLPHLVEKMRGSAAFRVVDGVIGAIILTAFVIALLYIAGFLLNRLYSYEIMDSFNTYMAYSPFANSIYQYNPFVNVFKFSIT